MAASPNMFTRNGRPMRKNFLIGAAARAFAVAAPAQTPPPPPLQPSSAAVMAYCWDPVALAVAACGSGHTGGTVTNTQGTSPWVTGMSLL